MLTEVQKQLERAFPTRKLMFPVTTTLEIRQELKAATVRGHVRSFGYHLGVIWLHIHPELLHLPCVEEVLKSPNFND